MWLRSLYYVKKSFDTLKLTKEELSKFQNRRLSHILESADTSSIYDNFGPDSYSNEEFSELPIIDSEFLSKSAESFENSYERRTSGTEGQPIKVRFTEQAHDWLSALYVRSLYIQEYQFGLDIVQHEDEMTDQRTWIGKKAMPKKYVDPKSSIDDQIEVLSENDPEVISYFPQTLVAICKKLSDIDNVQLDPQLVLTYGEPLTESTREYIEETLNAPVRDNYATTEFGTVAWECPEGGYHIAEDSVHAEILDEDQESVSQGEIGQLVLTGLVNDAIPLIRYNIGDLVENGGNSCGCDTEFKKIKKIKGRKENVIKNAEGNFVFPDEIIDKIVSIEEIIMFQIEAEDDKYIFRYVQSKDFSKEDRNKVRDILRSKFSLEPVEIKKVDYIPCTSGGKLRLIINNQTSKIKY